MDSSTVESHPLQAAAPIKSWATGDICQSDPFEGLFAVPDQTQAGSEFQMPAVSTDSHQQFPEIVVFAPSSGADTYHSNAARPVAQGSTITGGVGHGSDLFFEAHHEIMRGASKPQQLLNQPKLQQNHQHFSAPPKNFPSTNQMSNAPSAGNPHHAAPVKSGLTIQLPPPRLPEMDLNFENFLGSPGVIAGGNKVQAMSTPEVLKPLVETPDPESFDIVSYVFDFQKAPNSSTSKSPELDEFEGVHSLKIQVESSPKKNQFYFSSSLNKLFCQLEEVVPVKVDWDSWDGTPRTLRCLLIFADSVRMKDPVKMCSNHRENECKSTNHEQFNHVLRCENEDAKHEVDKDSGRYSVSVPLQITGTNFSHVLLKFMCLTSCTGGINRSNTELVFTLEDERGVVLGRRRMNVRICKVPKRDKELEEEKEENRLKETEGGQNKPKKRKRRKQVESSEESRRQKLSTQLLVTISNEDDTRLVIECLKKLNEDILLRRGGSSPAIELRRISKDPL